MSMCENNMCHSAGVTWSQDSEGTSGATVEAAGGASRSSRKGPRPGRNNEPSYPTATSSLFYTCLQSIYAPGAKKHTYIHLYVLPNSYIRLYVLQNLYVLPILYVGSYVLPNSLNRWWSSIQLHQPGF